MMTTLFFGSFNPPHRGHTAMAEYMLGKGLCQELWFVVSPLNPLKESLLLTDGCHRLNMTRLVVDGTEDNIAVCDVEFSMPVPSYTIDTLDRLRAIYPERDFSLLAGGDILDQFEQWKDFRRILEETPLFIYPRKGMVCNRYPDRITLLKDAPQLEFSSTEVRNAILRGESLSSMLVPQVEAYITDNNLWNYALLRGKRLFEEGEKHHALNCFLKTLKTDPGNVEAHEYATILHEIFEFRNMDIYNV